MEVEDDSHTYSSLSSKSLVSALKMDRLKGSNSSALHNTKKAQNITLLWKEYSPPNTNSFYSTQALSANTTKPSSVPTADTFQLASLQYV
jgi:ABC-type sulfate transport system substrate-binding protein